MTKTLNDRLFDAIKEDDLKEVSKCLKEGADVYATDSKGQTPLHLAYKSVAIAELLIEHGADFNATDNKGLTPLHNSCFYNRIEIPKLLIEKGADINLADNKGLTPLHNACSTGRTTVVKLLIENGAKVNITDNTGLDHTPLHKACLTKYAEIVKLLIDNGANVNATSDGSPLYIAWAFKRTEIVKLLISAVLLKNLGKKEKPNYIKNHEDFSAYWDKQNEIIDLKINYLPKEEILNSKSLARTILNKVSSDKDGSLVSYSFHQFFKSLNTEAIKNKITKEDDQTISDIMPSF